MDSWLQDQLLGSWEQEYAEGGNPGCIMGFGDILEKAMGVRTHSIPKANNHTKKHKHKSKSKKDILEDKIIKELGTKSVIISTPTNNTDPIYKVFTDQPSDNWFLEWLNVTPEPVYADNYHDDDWFLEWLNTDPKG